MDSVSVREDEKVLKVVGGDGYTITNAPNATKLHLKIVLIVHFMLCIFYHIKRKKKKSPCSFDKFMYTQGYMADKTDDCLSQEHLHFSRRKTLDPGSLSQLVQWSPARE